jgi:hypothetical protein
MTVNKTRQAALITLGALALLVAFHFLPSSPAITPRDFLAVGPNLLEFCDPSNPRFLAVLNKTPPVVLTVTTAESPVAGRVVHAAIVLKTATGKPIGPDDLIVTDLSKLNLLAVDPDLLDFQHLSADPQGATGSWRFEFTPRRGGTYRLFADFTPRATAREMYVSADLAVQPTEGLSPTEKLPLTWAVTREGVDYSLRPSVEPILAHQPVEFTFNEGMTESQSANGERLAIFDEARNGMAYLHPGGGPFKVTLSDPGIYTAWVEHPGPGGPPAVSFRFEVRP